MRRHLALLVTVSIAAVAPVFLAPVLVAPARADDAEKAAADYKALETWLADQNPKTADDRKALRVELSKRLKAFLKDHPSAGLPTARAKNALATVVTQDLKHDEALALYEDVLKNGDDELQQRARWGIIKALVGKKDTKGARTRLDAFMKEKPEDTNLKELDDYLKKLEGSKPVSLKVGAPAPAIKAKGPDDKEVELASFKGKIVLIDFWATWCPPCKKELPALKKLYAELHAKGFEIVGIDCFEKDWAAYKTFVEKEQVSWPQVAKDEAKPVAREYGVEHIPRTVLVGKSGEVLALDLRGDSLAAAVRAALDGKPLPKEKPLIDPNDKPKGDE